MLLFDHLQYVLPSLQQHALSLGEDNGKIISKQAIDKRFNEAALQFTYKLFETLMGHQLAGNRLPSHLSDHFNSIKVMDSTEFKLPDYFARDFPGYGNNNAPACGAIQLEYDILNKKIHFLSLSSARKSDKTFADQRMDNISQGDLILRDLGYYSTDSYAKIEQRKAFYVSRLKAQVSIYQKTAGGYVALSWTDILKMIKKSKSNCFDQWVYIGKEQRHPVRLMAWLLPPHEQQKRLQRKQLNRGRIRKEDLIWSKLNMLITNINETAFDAQQVYNLYKIRWQIECMFKTWKSILNIDITRKMKTGRFKCYLYSKFIWVLVCWDITRVVELSIWKSAKKLMSPYKCMDILKVKVLELKKILFAYREQVLDWLINTTGILINYGQKENRNGKVQLKDLLQLK